MRKDTVVTLSVLGGVVLLMAGYALYTQYLRISSPTPQSETVAQIQAGAYRTLDGQPVELQSAASELTVVVSWASWCPSCEQELNQAIALSEQYASQGVSVIALNRAESPVRMQQYINATIPSLLDSNVVLLEDSDDHFFASIDGYTVPETILLSAEGTILHHVRGPMNRSQLQMQIEEYLQ